MTVNSNYNNPATQDEDVLKKDGTEQGDFDKEPNAQAISSKSRKKNRTSVKSWKSYHVHVFRGMNKHYS